MSFNKYFIILIFSFCFCKLIYSQTAPAIQWAKVYGGNSTDVANSIIQTKDGGYIVAGFSSSKDGQLTGNHGGTDYWILKINNVGTIEWQKYFGGSYDDKAKAIIQTVDGGYIVIGDAASGDGDVIGNHNFGGASDYWVLKLSSIGDLQWQKCYGGDGHDYGYCIEQTKDGGFILGGNSWAQNPLGGGSSGDVKSNHGGGDAWIVKTDNQGNVEWEKCYGGTGGEEARSIKQAPDGGYIFVGSATSFDGDVTGVHGNTGTGFFDCWAVKISATGNLEWQKAVGGIYGDRAFSVLVDADGGYLMAGFASSNDGNISGHNGGADYWVVKFDGIGNIKWQKCLGGGGNDYAYSIIKSSDGDYVIAGGSESMNGDVTYNHGFAVSDYWIAKFNSNGIIKWQKSLGGYREDFAYSIQETTDGGYIIAGYASSDQGDVTGHYSVGVKGEDFWIVKLAAELVVPCVPTISISTPSTSICKNTPVIFTPIITNGGNSPQYQWKVNGNDVGASTTQFSSSTLNNGDIITCGLTSNATCATVTKVASNSIIITVNPLPKIKITGDSCIGSSLKVVSDLPMDSIKWQLNTSSFVSVKNAGYTTSGTTVAGGNGSGAATNQLASPDRIFVDNAGTMYIPDLGNERVLKWAAGASSGVVVAGGNGTGSAANQLNRPTGLFVDKLGNIFIADQNNGRIQKWVPGSTQGITVAGVGLNGYLGSPTAVFVDANGNIYVSEQNNSQVTKFLAGTTTPIKVAGGNGYGSAANQLSAPTGIYVDAKGNVYVCDTDNDRVTMWTPGATAGVTVAGGNGYGSGANQLANPLSVFVDVSGNLIISDFNNFRVQKWAPNATNGVTIAGGNGRGNASNQFNQPIGAFLTTNNDLYVADFYNNRVQKFSYSITDTYKPLIEGIYTATVTSSMGCSVTSTPIVIVSFKTPSVTITASASNICLNKPVSFTAVPTYGGSMPSYQWKINGINTGTDTAVFITSILKDGDIVSCAMKSNSSQCLISSNALSNALIMRAMVMPQLQEIQGSNIVCINTNTVLTNATAGGIWGTSNTTLLSIDSVGRVTGITAGIGSVFYTITDGCTTQTKIFSITVMPLPMIQNTTVVYELCDNHLGTISIETTSATIFSINSGATQTLPVFNGLNPGLYKIMATDSFGCSTSKSVTVDKIITPKPFVNISSSNPTCFRPQTGSISVSISGLEQPYSLVVNGKNYNSSANIVNLLAGNYTLKIYNKNSCLVDSITKDILLIDDGTCDTLYVPSAFTPNNDGKNDIMRPIGGALVKDITFKIFNRFGNIVFEGHDTYSGWNGKINGILQDGNTVYVWYITYTDRNGKVKINKGTSVLLR